MASYSFYQLSVTPIEKALPRLIEKIYKSGFRVLIVPDSQNKLELYNTCLWTYTPLGFLPHDYQGNASEHPIWLALEPINFNSAEVIVFPDGNPNDSVTDDYKKSVVIFDSNIPEQVNACNACISSQSKLHVKYWQQDSHGQWQNKNQL